MYYKPVSKTELRGMFFAHTSQALVEACRRYPGSHSQEVTWVAPTVTVRALEGHCTHEGPDSPSPPLVLFIIVVSQ